MNRDHLLQLKHVLITASRDEYDQLLAVVICPENDYTETVILTKSDTYTFECEHGTLRMPIRVAGDFTTFVVGNDHFFPSLYHRRPNNHFGTSFRTGKTNQTANPHYKPFRKCHSPECS